MEISKQLKLNGCDVEQVCDYIESNCSKDFHIVLEDLPISAKRFKRLLRYRLYDLRNNFNYKMITDIKKPNTLYVFYDSK